MNHRGQCHTGDYQRFPDQHSFSLVEFSLIRRRLTCVFPLQTSAGLLLALGLLAGLTLGNDAGGFATYVGFTTLFGKAHLALTLLEPGFLFLGQGVDALVAAHTLLIFRALFIVFGNGPATGVALVVITTLQVMVDGNPVVEYKTLALPQAPLLRHLFQVLQNAALEVIHLVKPLFFQVSGGLFATKDRKSTRLNSS